MTTAEARKIIESLAHGRGPQSGEPLPLESLFQQPNVVRALFIASRALERVERMERRDRSLPDNAGRPWEVAEEQQLSRLERLGKLPAEPRRHSEP